MTLCSSCRENTEHRWLGGIPLDELVDDTVRNYQLTALKRGEETRHSHNIVSRAPLVASVWTEMEELSL